MSGVGKGKGGVVIEHNLTDSVTAKFLIERVARFRLTHRWLSVAFLWLLLLSATLVVALWFSARPGLFFIVTLWAGALSSTLLPIRSQLWLFWVMLPFMGLLKRLVFLDGTAGIIEMYLVLATQDIVLGIILFKFILYISLSSRVDIDALDVAVGVFGLYSMLSALFLSSNVPFIARLATVESRIWPMVMYFLAANYLNRSRDLERLTRLTIAAAVVVALYGVFQFFGGFLPFEEAWYARATTSSNVAHIQHDIQEASVFRTFATMDSHGTYGIFLGLGLILAWARRGRLGAFLWLSVSFIITLGLILSFTRYTWIMPPIAGGFILLFRYRRIKPLLNLQGLRRGSRLLLIVVGSFLIFYLLLSNLYGTQLISGTHPYLRRSFGTSTLYARLQWRNYLSTQRISILGEGLASVGYMARKFGFESSDVQFHNIFVDMVESMGVIGLGLFLWLLYLLFRRARLSVQIQSDAQTHRSLAAVFGLILAMLTVGHFNGAVFYFGRALPHYFWGFCGVLTHYNKQGVFLPERRET